MKFLIAGGGIGGISAGVALRLSGHDAVVFEQAEAFAEFGAGLQLSPNATRHLLSWDVRLDKAFSPDAIEMRMGKSGRRVFSLPIKSMAEARWGAPYFHIHRADLHDALCKRFTELGGEIKFGVQVDAYKADNQGITIGGVTGDYVIAADGVHSKLRNLAFEETKPSFTGQVAWRTIVPASEIPMPPKAMIWVGAKQHAVTTRIKGGEFVNFVGITEEREWQEEGWHLEVESETARARFAGWQVEPILEKAQSVYRWALLSRAPLERFHEGRLILLGDAAHPMLPSLAQGAAQAIEDAAALKALGQDFTPEAYTAKRQSRANQVQAASKKALMRYHRAGAIRGASYSAAWLAGKIAPEILIRQFDWIYRE